MATYELSNNRGKPLSLDLCTDHEKALLEVFRPQAITTTQPSISKAASNIDKLERKRKADRDRKYRKYHAAADTRQHRRGGDYWKMREMQVMEAMAHLKSNVHIKDVMKDAEITKATAGNTLRRLVAMKKVTATGGRGRFRRYHLPTA